MKMIQRSSVSRQLACRHEHSRSTIAGHLGWVGQMLDDRLNDAPQVPSPSPSPTTNEARSRPQDVTVCVTRGSTPASVVMTTRGPGRPLEQTVVADGVASGQRVRLPRHAACRLVARRESNVCQRGDLVPRSATGVGV